MWLSVDPVFVGFAAKQNHGKYKWVIALVNVPYTKMLQKILLPKHCSHITMKVFTV